jgi:hypothetical protein
MDAAHASAELSFLLHERFLGAIISGANAQAEPLQQRQLRGKPTGCGCARRSNALYQCISSFILSLDAFHDVVMMALLQKEWPPARGSHQGGASIPTQKALF